MPYTNPWTTVSPDNLTLANQIDDEFRKFRVDVQERMNTIIGAPGDWATDPVIDGANVRSLSSLSSGLVGKPNINATDNFIPKRLNSTSLTDSAISDDGTTVFIAAGRRVKINGIEYTWPTSAPVGTFLRANVGGILDWASVTALGVPTGTGSTGRIPKWTSPSNISDSLMIESPTLITVQGALVATNITGSGTVQGLNVIATNNLQVNNTLNFGTLPVVSVDYVNQLGTIAHLNLSTTLGNGIIFDIAGPTFSTPAYSINGNQVIGPRRTGWGTPTGSKVRNSFSGNTTFIGDIAPALAALISDLIDHGLIHA